MNTICKPYNGSTICNAQAPKCNRQESNRCFWLSNYTAESTSARTDLCTSGTVRSRKSKPTVLTASWQAPESRKWIRNCRSSWPSQFWLVVRASAECTDTAGCCTSNYCSIHIAPWIHIAFCIHFAYAFAIQSYAAYVCTCICTLSRTLGPLPQHTC